MASRARDYVTSSRPILEDVDRKPSLSELEELVVTRPHRVTNVAERLETRRPSRAGEEERMEVRRPNVEPRKPSTEDREPDTDGRRGARRGQRFDFRDRYDNVKSRAIDLNSKMGTSGTRVDLIANFFPMVTKPTWCLYNYRVDYAPEEERVQVKKRLLRVHNAIIGANIFDGSNMYTIRRLDPEVSKQRGDFLIFKTGGFLF